MKWKFNLKDDWTLLVGVGLLVLWGLWITGVLLGWLPGMNPHTTPTPLPF